MRGIDSSLVAAVDEILATAIAVRTQAEHRAAVEMPIRLIDRMLDDLEQMNLEGGRRVPLSWERRIGLLRVIAPAEVADADLRTRVNPTRLMDALFEVQDRLLDRKVPGRAALRRFDEGHPASGAA